MSEYFYKQDINLTSAGDAKLSLLYLDSCYLICEQLLKYPELYEYVDDETKAMLFGYGDHDTAMCVNNSEFHQNATAMMTWFDSVLEEQSKDPSIVWKASFEHHMMFGAYYPDDGIMMKDFLSKMEAYGGYDVYFNGHEHLMSFSTVPKNASKLEPNKVTGGGWCHYYHEWFNPV
jgi:hypothetical protein